MAKPSRCPACGEEIPEGYPFGLCPCALGKAPLASEGGDGVTEENGRPPSGSEARGVSEQLHEIGPYRVIRKLGEGGFGVVYLAWQRHPVRREVAIKSLRQGVDSRQVIERFKAERRTLARLEHPHISTIYDAGYNKDGSPYFVMEYVRGLDIRNYCRENGLGIEERVELFKKVCHAVHHAHQKGIVHRDLKPANILVVEGSDETHPKIIDFGIAKLLSAEHDAKTRFLTQQHQVVGTLAYMSPEQASGARDVDTRADIYSLGAILYELLCGSAAFTFRQLRGQSYTEMLEFVCRAVPPLPSACAARRQSRGRWLPPSGSRPLDRILRGDLDSIVAKAMEKSREARFQTAQEIVEDLERYQKSEPVLAARAGRVYLARKFLRRYRSSVISAAFSLAVLALVFGVSTGMAWRASEARARETLAWRSAERAVDSRKAAQSEMDSLLNHTFSTVFRSLETSADLDVLEIFARRAYDHYASGRIANLPLDEQMRQVELFANIGAVFEAALQWEEAVKAYDRAIRRKETLEFAAESELRRWISLPLRLARCLMETGAADDALRQLDEMAAALAAVPEAERWVLSAEVASLRSLIHEKEGDVEAAVFHLQDALRWRKAAAANLIQLTETRCRLAALLHEAGRATAAQEVLEATVKSLREEGNSALQSDHDLMLALVRSLDLQGDTFKEKDPSRARVAYEEAVNLLANQSFRSATRLILEAGLREDLSVLAESEGQIPEAEAHQLGALNAYLELRQKAREPVWLEKAIRSHLRLGRLLAFQKKPFKHHWHAGLELVQTLSGSGRGAMAADLKQELIQLKGQWLSGLR